MHQSRNQQASCSCCCFLRPGDGGRSKVRIRQAVDRWHRFLRMCLSFDLCLYRDNHVLSDPQATPMLGQRLPTRFPVPQWYGVDPSRWANLMLDWGSSMKCKPSEVGYGELRHCRNFSTHRCSRFRPRGFRPKRNIGSRKN